MRPIQHFPHAVFSITQFQQLTFYISLSHFLSIAFAHHLTNSTCFMYFVHCSHNSNNSKSNYTYIQSFFNSLFLPINLFPHSYLCWVTMATTMCNESLPFSQSVSDRSNDTAKRHNYLLQYMFRPFYNALIFICYIVGFHSDCFVAL